MLDVHILLSSDTRPDWQRQCVSSIVQAARRASFPVTIHKVAGISGHIGRGRAAGYALGTHSWVTCVDDDDWVLPDAFANMFPGLQSGAQAVSTAEMELRNDTFRPGGQRHHLVAYRRGCLIDHTVWPCCGDVAQRNAISPHDWFDVTTMGYLWRVYEGSKARSMRIENPDELVHANG